MRCEECLPLVEAYFDGELDARTSSLVAQHVGDCPVCASLYEGLESEQDIYLRYECDSQPKPEFWATVMERAAEETSRPPRAFYGTRDWLGRLFGGIFAPRFSPSLTALIVLVAVGATLLLTNYFNRREKVAAPVVVSQAEGAPAGAPLQAREEVAGPVSSTEGAGTGEKGNSSETQRQPRLIQIAERGRKTNATPPATGRASAERMGRSSSTANQERTADELVREAEQKYVAAIEILSRDVNRRRPQLDPQTVSRFERTLAAVDHTISETRRASRRHPDDPVAARYMLTAYAKKVEVLRELIGY
ncbi:MAG TPA: zf-HC2 domain-containing protein [Pyrinomonadaceae bacterium]|nr:zf-HC2 domain-containing protein [Pyrinomonadaceae bacterium]